MIQRTSSRLIIFTFLLGIILAFPVFAQDRMTYEDYVAVLERWVERENEAQTQIQRLENEIAALQSQINETEDTIAALWDEIYSDIAVSKQTESGFLGELAAIDKALAVFDRLSPEAIYQRQDELEELEQSRKDLFDRPEALLTENIKSLEELGMKYNAISSRMAKPLSKMYTVVYGDYLWKIAKMPEHYGDPMKWMRIYSANLDQINDADLIYPEQRFTIPLSIDKKKQYLVERGDFLYSIAQSVYGDPFQWRKIYENNRRVVEDPSVIYPETILSIPGR